MIILHIFHSLNRKFAGADVIVPEHIKAQQATETVGCVNITNTKIEDIENQFDYNDDFKLSSLPEPFNKPDIIIFHQVYFSKFLGIAKQARKAGIPYVIIPHGSLTKQAQGAKKIKKMLGNFLFFNKFINGARAIQYLSEDEKNRSFRKLSCFVSTNGMYMPSEQKTEFNNDKTIFTFIGRYDIHIKGLDLLVNAIKKKEDLLRKNNCVFNLYGPHTPFALPNIESLKTMLNEQNVADLITINEGLFDDEKALALLNTDIFIQCSRTEAMGLSIAEALSYGVPSLVTYSTTMGDIIDKYDAGWSCETTVESIANTIEKAILEKTLLNEKSKNATVLIEKNFLWDNVAKDALENYRKFI